MYSTIAYVSTLHWNEQIPCSFVHGPTILLKPLSYLLKNSTNSKLLQHIFIAFVL